MKSIGNNATLKATKQSLFKFDELRDIYELRMNKEFKNRNEFLEILLNECNIDDMCSKSICDEYTTIIKLKNNYKINIEYIGDKHE